jgi:hypothetical protein
LVIQGGAKNFDKIFKENSTFKIPHLSLAIPSLSFQWLIMWNG